MPRSRLIGIVWLIGTLLLLGAWIHSLAQATTLQAVLLKQSRMVELSILGGSFELSWSTVYGTGPFRVQLNEHAPPRHHWGRFHYARYQSGAPPFAMERTTAQIPLGILILLHSLLCSSLIRRFRARGHRASP